MTFAATPEEKSDVVDSSAVSSEISRCHSEISPDGFPYGSAGMPNSMVRVSGAVVLSDIGDGGAPHALKKKAYPVYPLLGSPVLGT